MLRTLFDSLPTAVLVADDRAFYVSANLAAAKLLERPRNEVVGVHLSDIVSPGRQAEADAQWQSFIRDGEQSGVFALTLPDGRHRLAYFHARANFLPGLHCSFLTPIPDETPQPGAELLTMCAWTKRVRLDGEWMSIERYLGQVHGVSVSHGISPGALELLAGKADAHDE